MNYKILIARLATAIGIFLIPIIIVSSVIIIVNHCKTENSNDPNSIDIDELIQTAKELESYQKSFELPSDEILEYYPIKKNASILNPMQYFNIFKHLRIDSNIIIDFAYSSYCLATGEPTLYFRYNDEIPLESKKVAYHPSKSEEANRLEYYRTRPLIHLDGSKNSFLELALYRMQAEQFYLWGYANYNDNKIIFSFNHFLNKFGNRYAISDGESYKIKKEINNEYAKKEIQERYNLFQPPNDSYFPKVDFISDTAIVELYYFTKWGGINKKITKYSRCFPHVVLGDTSFTVVKYDCGIMF